MKKAKKTLDTFAIKSRHTKHKLGQKLRNRQDTPEDLQFYADVDRLQSEVDNVLEQFKMVETFYRESQSLINLTTLLG